MTVRKKTQSNETLYEKQCVPGITESRIRYFAAATFKDLSVASFQRE